MTSPIFKTTIERRALDLRAILGASVVSLALGACGSSAPTQQLVDARRAYKEAETSAAAKLTPDTLLSAQQALDVAEKAHKDDPGSKREAHLAYIAERKSEIAKAQGLIAAWNQAEQEAKSNYQSKLEHSAKKNQDQLASAQNQLQAAQQGKQEADARAAAAIASLQEVATVKEEERGTVITLSGSVLFPTGGDALSDVARQSLDQVATALAQQPEGSHIRVEGYTDARGSDTSNEQLSQRRAQAVRDYLAQKGVDSERLEAIGRGESSPIASNDTPDGRASNRRVEIVIEPQQGQPPNVVGSVPSKPSVPSSSAKSQQPQMQQPTPASGAGARH
jgi:outer membrane protein OmpA-like peptidoglycan-associated protein